MDLGITMMNRAFLHESINSISWFQAMSQSIRYFIQILPRLLGISVSFGQFTDLDWLLLFYCLQEIEQVSRLSNFLLEKSVIICEKHVGDAKTYSFLLLKTFLQFST